MKDENFEGARTIKCAECGSDEKMRWPALHPSVGRHENAKFLGWSRGVGMSQPRTECLETGDIEGGSRDVSWQTVLYYFLFYERVCPEKLLSGRYLVMIKSPLGCCPPS